MVAYPLVDKDLDAGQDLLRQLKDAGIPFRVAFWIYSEESQDWRLTVVTPLVDSEGPLEAYRRIQEVMSETELANARLRLSDIKVVSPSDKVALAMEAAAEQNSNDEFLHFFRSVIFGVFVDDVYIYRTRS